MAKRRGQSLLEFALFLPILLLLLLGTADLGRVFWYRGIVDSAARDALRIATQPSQQATGDTVCSSGGTASAELPPTGGPGTIDSIASAVALESTIGGASALQGGTLTLTWHCTPAGKAVINDGATSTDPEQAGSAAIRATVSYQVTLLGGLTIPAYGLSSTSYGRAQY